MQTSRVFLIDAYQYPFAPELEFDAEAIAGAMEAANADVVRMGTMGKYCTIQGARFAVHPDQGDRDLLAEMIAACKPRGMKVVPYISTGHKIAWSQVTEQYPEYARVTKPGGGLPDRNHMYVGEDHGTVCWNTPYRQAYLNLVEHVVRDYDVAGMYFDAWVPHYFWEGGMRLCYCDGCRDGFRKATDLEIPWHENRGEFTEEERKTIEAYHHWYQDELMAVLRETRRIIKSYKDIPLICNISNPRRMTTTDPRVVENMDAFLYERGHTMVERAEGVSLARALGLYVWPYIGGYDNWPRVVYNGLDYQQEIFTTAMFGGGCIVAQPTGFIRYQHNSDIVAYPFGIIRRYADSFQGFSNVPHVAVVYAQNDPPGHAQENWFWNADARTATLGAFAACLARHVQVSSIMETVLDNPSALNRYKVLYLADVPHLSPQRVENIKAFVQQGGGLIASWATSLYNADDEKQDRFALEDLIHVRPIQPSGDLKFYIENYAAVLGGPNDLYIQSREGEFNNQWAGRPLPAWYYEPVEILDGGRTAADIVRGDGMQPILPAVVTSRYGQGKVVYLASSLESLFQQNNNQWVGEFLESLITAVAPAAHPYIVDAPQSLIVNLTENGDRRVLHLTNWTGNKYEKTRTNEYYIAPVENVRILLRKPDGCRITNLGLFINAEYDTNEFDNMVEIHLRGIDAYQGISYTIQ